MCRHTESAHVSITLTKAEMQKYLPEYRLPLKHFPIHRRGPSMMTGPRKSSSDTSQASPLRCAQIHCIGMSTKEMPAH